MTRCEYANARVGARRGRLLGPEVFAELLAKPDLPARLKRLGATDYGPWLAARSNGRTESLAAAERAFRDRLVREIADLFDFLKGSRSQEMFAAVVAFEDVFNVKAVLRGHAAGLPAERIVDLTSPTPTLTAVALGELASEPNVKGVVDRLVTWGSPYGKVLQDSLPAFQKRKDLLPLETALDVLAYQRALECAKRDGEDGKIVEDLLRREIDKLNATTLLTLSGQPDAPECFISGGGALDSNTFHRLLGRSTQEKREALRELLPEMPAEHELRAVGDDSPLIDRSFSRRAEVSLRRLARSSPLSLAVPLAYLFARRAEVARLRLLLRATEFGIAPDQLAGLLETWEAR